jgi:hypothetical protein
VLLCVLGVVGYLASKVSDPVPQSPPASSHKRYSLSNEGVITKITTGQMLTRMPVAYMKTHSEAVDVCRNLNLEGYTDWEVPTQGAIVSLDRMAIELGIASPVEFFGGPNNCGSHRLAKLIWLRETENGRGLTFECDTLRTKYITPGFVGAVICYRSGRADLKSEAGRTDRTGAPSVTPVAERTAWAALGKEVNVRAGPGLDDAVMSTEAGGAAVVLISSNPQQYPPVRLQGSDGLGLPQAGTSSKPLHDILQAASSISIRP